MKNLARITDGKDVTTKEYVDGGIEAANRVVYGICDTAADDPDKEVILNCRDLDNLGKGEMLSVYFTYGNTASNPALFLYNYDETDDKPPEDIVMWADESTHITYLAGHGAWRNGEQVLFTMLPSGEWQIVGRQPALSDRYGVVELSDAVDSESGADSAKGLFPGPARAATPKAVKQAYDLAASKEDPPARSGTLPVSGVLEKNTMYYLGTINERISIAFPDNSSGDEGDWLYLNYSTPSDNVPTVTVDTDHSIGLDMVDWRMESCSYTAMAMWDGAEWVFAYRTIDISE